MTTLFQPVSWTPGIEKEVYHVPRTLIPRTLISRALGSRRQALRSPASLQSGPGQTAKARQGPRAGLLARPIRSDRARARAAPEAPSTREFCPERRPAGDCARIRLCRLAAHETKDRVVDQIAGRALQGGGRSGRYRSRAAVAGDPP